MYDETVALFTNPDGVAEATAVQVLQSLINQALVHQQAIGLGLMVSDQEIAEAVGEIPEIELSRSSLARTGGIEGIRRRMTTFLEFREVKSAVIGEVIVPDSLVATTHVDDPQLSALPFVDAAPVIRKRLIAAEADRRWASWLAQVRTCADVTVFDASLGVPSSTPGPSCGN